MTAASTTTSPAIDCGQHIVLTVSLDTYERLLADHLDRSAPRPTCDRGVLEIVGPSIEHEELNRALALAVEVAAEETGINRRNVDSMTFKRADRQRGSEADSSRYIEREVDVRGKSTIDPERDPPPD